MTQTEWRHVPTPRGPEPFEGAITCTGCGESWQIVPVPFGTVMQIIDGNRDRAVAEGWDVPGSNPVGTGTCPRCAARPRVTRVTLFFADGSAVAIPPGMIPRLDDIAARGVAGPPYADSFPACTITTDIR